MNPVDPGDLVVRRVKDGSGRDHDVFLAQHGKDVTLSCPSAFWSITFTADEGYVLASAIQGASDRARGQASS